MEEVGKNFKPGIDKQYWEYRSEVGGGGGRNPLPTIYIYVYIYIY